MSKQPVVAGASIGGWIRDDGKGIFKDGNNFDLHEPDDYALLPQYKSLDEVVTIGKSSWLHYERGNDWVLSVRKVTNVQYNITLFVMVIPHETEVGATTWKNLDGTLEFDECDVIDPDKIDPEPDWESINPVAKSWEFRLEEFIGVK